MKARSDPQERDISPRGDRGGDAALYRRILRLARPWWLQLGGVLALSMLAGPLAVLTPVPLKLVVDSAIGSRPVGRPFDWLLPGSAPHSWTWVLALAAILLIAISLLSRLQEMLTAVWGAYVSERLVLDFRATLFHHAHRLSISYHDRKGTADTIHRIQSDALALQYITTDGFLPFVSAGVTLIGMIWVTARVDWQLSLIALAVSPVLVILSRQYRPLLREKWAQVRELESSALSVVHEALGALRVVQAFGRQDYERERYVRRSEEGVGARLHVAWIEGRYGLLVGVTMAAGTAAALVLGVRHVRAGSLTLGNLLLVMTYLAQLFDPLKIIGRKSAGLQGHLASLRRAFRLLDEVPDVVDRPHARRLARASGSISYRNVSFAYPGGQPVLREVSFEVPPGARVGIAGRTGAGKTTLVSLLPRFHDVSAGEILVDGVDLREFKLEDLRNQFSIVLQEPVLFSTSIAENIAYAQPGASEAAIIQAAQLANAHDFILGLPDGYRTLVGERGMRLSGGERQRVSLARAFLKDAPILILDEPTSSVDLRTEASIIEAMERLMRGRTTFMIAHRLSTLDHCDFVLTVEAGRVSVGQAKGSHAGH